MNTIKPIFIILSVGIFVVPQIAFAAWWNPLTWSIFRKKEPIVIEQTQDPFISLGLVPEKKQVSQKDFDPIEHGATPVAEPIKKRSKIKSDAIKIEQCKTNAEEIKRALYEETHKSAFLSLYKALSAAVIKPDYYVPDASTMTLVGALEALTYNANEDTQYYKALNDISGTADTLAKKTAEEKSFTAYNSFYYSCLEE